MDNVRKTEAQLQEELAEMRARLAELEAMEEEHKWLDQAIDALMGSAPDHIFFKDKDSHFIKTSEAHAQVLGVGDAQEVVGKTDFDFFPLEDAQRFYTEERRIMESGEEVIAREWAVPSRGGGTLWVSEHKIPITDESGRVVGLVGITRDITARKRAEEALERRALHLQTVAEVSRATSSILDPRELIWHVVNLILERFDLYYVGLFLVDQEGRVTDEPGEWAVLQAGTGEAGRKMVKQRHQLPIGGQSMIGACVTSGEAHIALDVGEEAVRFDNPLLPDTHSELALPLNCRGETIGALSIQSVERAAFDEQDIAIFQIMADQVANSIENARLFHQSQEALKELEAAHRNYLRQSWGQFISRHSRGEPSRKPGDE